MQTFQTTDGAEWQIVVNMGTIRRVLLETKIKLTDLFASQDTQAELFADDLRFCEVIAATIAPQLQAAGRTFDDFLAVVDGAVIEKAVTALLEETADFFPEPRRGLLKLGLKKATEHNVRIVDAQCVEATRRLEATPLIPMSSDMSSQESAA